MIGRKKGLLTIIEFSHAGNNYNKFWKAKCECGNTRILCTADFNKNNCPIISCGCYKTTEDPVQRFLKFVDKSESCWIWKGSYFETGYGQFWLNKKTMTAHKSSWILLKNEKTNGKCVCHTCDNRFCVNPDHLFLGSHKDNTQDMIKKGRQPIQKRKICTEDREKIINMHYQGIRQRDIGKLFGVHQWHINRIIHENIPSKSLSGEGNCNAKLTAEIVLEMRKLRITENKSFTEIAKLFSVNYTTAERAIKGITWKHI
jgi:hypothetical protein